MGVIEGWRLFCPSVHHKESHWFLEAKLDVRILCVHTAYLWSPGGLPGTQMTDRWEKNFALPLDICVSSSHMLFVGGDTGGQSFPIMTSLKAGG